MPVLTQSQAQRTADALAALVDCPARKELLQDIQLGTAGSPTKFLNLTKDGLSVSWYTPDDGWSAGSSHDEKAEPTVATVTRFNLEREPLEKLLRRLTAK